MFVTAFCLVSLGMDSPYEAILISLNSSKSDVSDSSSSALSSESIIIIQFKCDFTQFKYHLFQIKMFQYSLSTLPALSMESSSLTSG